MSDQVIAGDSWGKLAVPVIKAHPETAIIFVGSLLTLAASLEQQGTKQLFNMFKYSTLCGLKSEVKQPISYT